MEVESIRKKIIEYKEQGLRLFTTSSFQTHSIPLLHIISEIDKDIPVYCINTGFLFPETLNFRDRIKALLGIKVLEVMSDTPKFMQKGSDGRMLFTNDPDHCCLINKTQPTEHLLRDFDVWINGVRRDQNANRQKMQEVQPTPFNAFRYHPILDWNSKMIYNYRKEHQLPEHPLDKKGYISIGCEPCTRRLTPDMDEREARWFGLNKTECGLHTDLIK
ncbi:MAG: phosphoadenylyl-sulfate reductase [Cyclobacteriaceae bacterium]|nr:phosphoadenylyl-sulfate reductase [Cyclobacteriaceae bacterium]